MEGVPPMHCRFISVPPQGAGRVLVVAVCTALVLASAGALPRAGSAARTDANGPYAIALTALTGPDATDLAVSVDPGAAAMPAALKKLQLKIFAADETVASVRNLKDVELDHGVVHVDLGNVLRGRRVEADVMIQTPSDPQTFVVRGATSTRFRPDLTVALFAPPQTTTARSIDVLAEVTETKGDTAATNASVTLMLGPTPLADPAVVSVPAGGKTTVTFSNVKLPNPVPTELSVFVDHAVPAEYDVTNNTRARTVDVTENELATARL